MKYFGVMIMSNVIDLDFFQRFGIIFTLERDELEFFSKETLSLSPLKPVLSKKRTLYHVFSKENILYLGMSFQ